MSKPYRLKVEDPYLDFVIYGGRIGSLSEAREARDVLADSRLVTLGTRVTVQEKVGWFKWVDVE